MVWYFSPHLPLGIFEMSLRSSESAFSSLAALHGDVFLVTRILEYGDRNANSCLKKRNVNS